MNELIALEEYVAAHPEERTPVRALVDLHQELLDVPYPVALRAVARIHRAARQAREMGEAAALLRRDQPNATSLYEIIRALAEIPQGQSFTVYIANGRKYPEAVRHGVHADGVQFDAWHVLIGALFVVAISRALTCGDPGYSMPSWTFPWPDSEF